MEGVLLATDLALAVRELVRQWEAQGKRLYRAGTPASSSGGSPAPIVQIIEITSATADGDGYPARVQTFDGTTWSDTYDEVRAVRAGGGTLTAGHHGPGRLMRKADSGYYVYAVTPRPFTVSETDGTPSSIVAVKFPVTALTDNGDGTVTVNVATATLAGILSQTGQTIGGYKIFADGIESSLGLEVNNGTATINTDLYVHGVGSQFTIDDYAGSPANLTLLCRATGLYPGGNVFGPEIYATADDLNSTGVMKVVFDLLDTDRRFVIWDSGSMPKIVLTDGSTVAIGATGTLAPGATFVGGIANSVGSGTFATFPADLTADVTGVLPEANGGTGYTTLAAALDALGGINL